MGADEKYNSICIEYPFILHSIKLAKDSETASLLLFASLYLSYHSLLIWYLLTFFFKSLLKCSKK